MDTQGRVHRGTEEGNTRRHKEGLEELKGQIPGMIDISVRTDYLPTSTVDVMLDTTFEDADALAAYAKNPMHVAVADTKVRPFTANRACMDFEV